MRKVAHLQVVVVIKAVWGIFNYTLGLYLQVNTLLVIYKSRDYSINVKALKLIKNRQDLNNGHETLFASLIIRVIYGKI